MLKLITTIKGFSLIEMSIALIIVSIVGVGILNMSVIKINNSKTADTIKKLEIIEDAILTFYNQNGRLPCPARGDKALDHAEFAIEGTPTYDATLLGLDYYCDTIPYNTGTGISAAYDEAKYSKGVVPVRTLNLPDEVMFDAWGRRISYMVENELTDQVAIANAYNGSIEVYTDYVNPVPIINNAAFVLISHGKSGHGGWLRTGVSRVNNVSNNPRRDLFNADDISNGGSTNFVPSVLMMPKNYYAPTDKVASIYDDIVRFKILQSIKQNKKDTFYSVSSRCEYGMFSASSVVLLSNDNKMHVNSNVNFDSINGIDDINTAVNNDLKGLSSSDEQLKLFIRKVYCKVQSDGIAMMAACFHDKGCLCKLDDDDISISSVANVNAGYYKCIMSYPWIGKNTHIQYKDGMNNTIDIGDTQKSMNNIICYNQQYACVG